MTKSLGYFVLTLEVVFTAWEWLFLFSAAYFLASVEHGGLLASMLFFTISVVRIAYSRFVAKRIEVLPRPRRLKVALLSRAGLALLAGALWALGMPHPYLLLVWMLAAGALYVTDMYCSLDLRYLLAENPHFSFARISSITNIGRRGVIAVASVVPLLIPAGEWHTLGMVLLIPMLSGVLSMSRLLVHAGDEAAAKPAAPAAAAAPTANPQRERDALVLTLYMLGFNLFFGSNALAIIRAIELHAIQFHAVNPLTAFYTAFVLTNVLLLLRPKIAERLSSWASLGWQFLLSGLCCVDYWAAGSSVPAFFSVAVLFGTLYAVQMTCLYVQISTAVRSGGQASTMARIDSWGRIGFVVSQLAVGLLLDTKIDPLVVSALFGGAAVVALGAYVGYRKYTAVGAPRPGLVAQQADV